jgi:hypothetical protein
VIIVAEGQVDCAMPTDVATKGYGGGMKAALPQTIWATGRNSWYLDENGQPELFPGEPARHRELSASPDLRGFDARTG